MNQFSPTVHAISLRSPLVALVLAALISGCSSVADPGTGDASIGEPVDTNQVAVDDNVYTPETIGIDDGDEVTWTWVGKATHDVVFDDMEGQRDFDSGLRSDGTFTVTVDTPGTIRYHCTIHPRMTGAIVVR